MNKEISRRAFLGLATAAAVAPEVTFAAPAEADPVKAVETAEQAAARYGGDSYTRDAANWEVFLPHDGHKDTGARLKNDGSGRHHRVQLYDTVVAELWVDLHADDQELGVQDDVPGDDRAVEVHLVRGKGLTGSKTKLTRGGTIREFPIADVDAAAHKNLEQMLQREATEQPGAQVIPVGFSASGPCA